MTLTNYDDDAKDFWNSIATMDEATQEALRPVRVTIVSDDGAGNVILTRDADPDQEPEGTTHPRIRGFKFYPGDPAYALPLGNEQLLVLDRLINAAFTEYDLDHPLNVIGAVTATGIVQGASILSDSSVVGDSLTIFGPATVEGDIDTSAANLIRTGSVAQSTADTTSTTNTVTYVTACEFNITLPVPGTWVIEAIGGGLILHSAGSANWLVQIDGNDGTARTLSATTENHFVDNHALSISSGVSNLVVPVRLRYKSSTAGTTSMRNPWLFAVARRSAYS